MRAAAARAEGAQRPDALPLRRRYPDKLGKTVAELRALPDVGQVRGVQ